MFQIIVIVLLIFSTAFFAIAELSLVASKKQRLLALADDGNSNARLALEMAKKPKGMIVAAQIGLTFVTLIEGAVTKKLLDPFLSPILIKINFLSIYATLISTILSFILVTFATILFGDIIPKRVALLYPENIAITLVPITSKMLKLLTPLINIFSFISDKILQILRMPIELNNHVSAKDIEDLFEAGAQSGLLDQTEKGLLDNVWRMDERRVGALMTPRSDIVYIDTTALYKDNLEIVLNNPSKRILVCKGNLDHILGVGLASIWLKDYLQQLNSGTQNPTISWLDLDNLIPVHSIPNTLTLIETLESFRKYKTHMVLVYNEFGHLEGLITMVDLMGAVVGEYPETLTENLLIHKDPSGKWLIDGLAPIDDVKNALGIVELPDEDLGNYHTAAGFALSILGSTQGRLPKEFDSFIYEGYIFEVVDVDRSKGYRIDQLMVQIYTKPITNDNKN